MVGPVAVCINVLLVFVLGCMSYALVNNYKELQEERDNSRKEKKRKEEVVKKEAMEKKKEEGNSGEEKKKKKRKRRRTKKVKEEGKKTGWCHSDFFIGFPNGYKIRPISLRQVVKNLEKLRKNLWWQIFIFLEV